MRHAIVLASFLLTAGASADDWPEAKPAGVASPGGAVVVRVLPGASIGDVHGFAGEPKGRYATAVFYRLDQAGEYRRYQEVRLVNPVAPLFVAVSDAGELVTLDNWHNMGLGKAVVVYRADGEVLRSYELSQIYDPAELRKLPASVSSVWWRCPAPPNVDPRSAAIAFHDALGNTVEVSFKTGEVAKRESTQKAC